MIDIYGTLGPACGAEETLKEMFSLGMTGLRLNLSHVTLEDSRELIETMGRAAAAAGVKPQLLIDLQGSELRTGTVEEPILLREGELVAVGGESLPVPELVFPFLVPGQEILLDDGKLLLVVEEDSDGESPAKDGPARPKARILRGGLLKSRKSLALPGAKIHPPTLTPADLENLRVAREFGVTAVMQPFVRGREDLETVRNTLNSFGGQEIRLFAKIENMDGVRRIEELLPACDEIVIARGDLGNAMPLWELPGVQKYLAGKCAAAGKPFMVVTQMLSSMEKSPVPTRAEVSDIFNAVLDGAASVMVTGETAVGEYPVEVIRYLVNTAESAEKFKEWKKDGQTGG